MANMFNIKGAEMQGKVVVRTRNSNLIKGAVIHHVVRNTSDDAVVLKKMSENTDIVKISDMVTVMSAFVKSVKDIMAHGNAVRVSGLGTFYLTAKETEKGGSGFSVSFLADNSLAEAAKMAKPEVTMPSESKPDIDTVQDLDNMEENGRVSAGKFVLLSGKRMRVAGSETVENKADGAIDSGGKNSTANQTDANSDGASGANSAATMDTKSKAETGIFMAPCDEFGNYKADMSDWLRVNDEDIRRNFMTEIIFRVPKLSGRYRIIIATKAPLNGSKRADKLLKHARMGASDAVTVA